MSATRRFIKLETVFPARVFLQHDLVAEDLRVELAGPSDAAHGDELGDEETLARGGHVLEVDEWRVLTILCSSDAF